MTKPSEFALLHYGTETVMMLDCILNPVMNLLISYMVFVSYIQKPSIASQSQGPIFFFPVMLSRSSSHMHIDECPHQLNFRGKKYKLHGCTNFYSQMPKWVRWVGGEVDTIVMLALARMTRLPS